MVWESNEADRSETPSLQEVITHPDGKVMGSHQIWIIRDFVWICKIVWLQHGRVRTKVEKLLAGGDRVISYPNGTIKQVSGDGATVKVNFFNGDTKEVTADHRVVSAAHRTPRVYFYF